MNYYFFIIFILFSDKISIKQTPSTLKVMETKSTMKHLHLNGFGDPSVLAIKESEIPKPKEGEVLLRIKASALNRADTIQRKGAYPPPPGASEILGLEAAGYVCNPDGTYDESKRVMALLSGGGCSQYCTVPKGHIMEVPKNMNLEDAGGLPEVWLTAFLLLELAQIKAGDKVLIYAGASGVGTAAIQLVKFYQGTSIVTVSTEEKAEFTKKLGASAAINYKTEQNVAQAVLNATGGKGVDIILDCVGQSFYQVGVEAAALDARWIIYGTMSGTKVPSFDFRDIMKKRLSLIASTLRSRSVEYKTELIERFKKTVLPEFESGRFQVHAEKVIKVDWSDVKPIREAHEMMESNANAGKIIFSFE